MTADAAGQGRQVSARIEAIEAAYEFMLAYAAQGASGPDAGGTGSEIRQQLLRASQALDGLAAALRSVAHARGLAPAAEVDAFCSLLGEDAARAGAAFRLVLAQPAIGSQVVDNLNALIHLRALLTDLFLIDELLALPASAESG